MMLNQIRSLFVLWNHYIIYYILYKKIPGEKLCRKDYVISSETE